MHVAVCRYLSKNCIAAQKGKQLSGSVDYLSSQGPSRSNICGQLQPECLVEAYKHRAKRSVFWNLSIDDSPFRPSGIYVLSNTCILMVWSPIFQTLRFCGYYYSGPSQCKDPSLERRPLDTLKSPPLGRPPLYKDHFCWTLAAVFIEWEHCSTLMGVL